MLGSTLANEITARMRFVLASPDHAGFVSSFEHGPNRSRTHFQGPSFAHVDKAALCSGTCCDACKDVRSISSGLGCVRVGSGLGLSFRGFRAWRGGGGFRASLGWSSIVLWCLWA